MHSVSFLGLGTMGVPMARRLLGAGFPVTVWNRTAARAEPLVAEGARLASTPRAAAEASDVVATMLADTPALEAVASGDDGLVAGLSEGKVWLDFSTIRPEDSRRLAALAAKKGASFCDVPVAGSVPAARSGQLVLLAGGEAAVLDRVRPVLSALAKGVEHVGPVGQGSALKLANNLFFAVTMAGFGEALALAKRLDLDVEKTAAWITGSSYAPPALKVKWDFWKAGGEPTQFSVALTEKDTRLMVEASNGRLGVVKATHDVFRGAEESGWGDKDVSHVLSYLLKS